MTFKELKPELVELQNVWGSQLQAARAPKGADGAPFPVKVLLEMQQPPQYSYWDVEWLKVLLVIEGPDLEDPPLSVEFPEKDLPEEMREKMAALTLAEWKTAIAKGGHSEPRWHLQETLAWVQSHFDSLLRVMPELVDFYMGVDANDVSQRRYTIVPPKKEEPNKVVEVTRRKKKKTIVRDSDSEEDSEGGSEGDASEEDKVVAARLKELEKARREQACREAQLEQQEAERKKAAAMAARERGDDPSKPKQLSKKEIEEKRKSKQGVRTSKTGSKATKYAGEGSAVEKAAKSGAGKKKK